MPSNVRVYELARELGMSNQEVLDLCDKLGIGARSHSSSIVEAQADRVRRRAEKDGLVKAPAAEETAPAEAAPPKNPKISTKKAPPRKMAAEAEARGCAVHQPPASTPPSGVGPLPGPCERRSRSPPSRRSETRCSVRRAPTKSYERADTARCHPT